MRNSSKPSANKFRSKSPSNPLSYQAKNSRPSNKKSFPLVAISKITHKKQEKNNRAIFPENTGNSNNTVNTNKEK